jgi:hypothetical protein
LKSLEKRLNEEEGMGMRGRTFTKPKFQANAMLTGQTANTVPKGRNRLKEMGVGNWHWIGRKMKAYQKWIGTMFCPWHILDLFQPFSPTRVLHFGQQTIGIQGCAGIAMQLRRGGRGG